MKKEIVIFIGCLLCFIGSMAQEIDTTAFSKKYYHMKSKFETLPDGRKEIIFLGNSITEQGSWRELFKNDNIINRGISGDYTDGILFRLSEVTSSKPIKIFLLIGTNDIRYGRTVEYIVNRNQQIVQRIKKESPKTKIYLQSILPTYGRKERPIDTIKTINRGLERVARQENIKYIDLFSHFIDNTGFLVKKYSLDGLHLNGEGYLKWKTLIEVDVND